MYKKLVIIFVVILAGAVFFVSRQNTHEKNTFSLLDQVEERQVMGVFNMHELLSDAKSISKKFKTVGLVQLYFDKVSDVMKNAGLRLDKVYYSIETRGVYKRSIYFQIIDQDALQSTFRNFSNFYELKQDSIDTSIYTSSEFNIAIRFNNNWLELVQGDLDRLEHNPSLSESARKLIKENHFFIFNPTDKDSMNASEYIVGDYNYDSILSIQGSWYCNKTAGHPVQMKDSKINIYPTGEKIIQAYLNVDREQWGQYDNKYLKDKLEKTYSKGLINYPRLSELWSGQFSFSFGGIKTLKTKTIVSEFDENFNPIEKTIIQTDTVRDVGFIFSSSDPKALHGELLNQSNIKSKKGDTYIALFPPLKPRFTTENLILSASSKEPTLSTIDKVISFTFNSSQLNIKAISSTKKNRLNYKIELIPQVSGKIKWSELINLFL
jgi:hypothetical protein